jgi:hypothetical protein
MRRKTVAEPLGAALTPRPSFSWEASMLANKSLTAAAAVLGLCLIPSAVMGEVLRGKTSSGGSCQIIIHNAPDTSGSGSAMSTTIQAGNGQVSGSTTMPGGQSVSSSNATQVQFGDDVPVTASSTSSSTTSPGGTVTVATAGGKTCTTTAQ